MLDATEFFLPTVVEELDAPLDPEAIEKREGANGKLLSYVEGWYVIAAANRIFGHGNWSHEVPYMEPVHEPKLIEDEANPEKTKVISAFMAKVRITVYSRDHGKSIVKESFGGARSFARTHSEAVEQAMKAAETDATKRALRLFGSQFGLSLYDKKQRAVRAPKRQAIQRREVAAIDEGFIGDTNMSSMPTSAKALVASGGEKGARPMRY